MYTVWTRPSTTKKARAVDRTTKTTKKAVGGVMTPVITRGILGSVPAVPLGGTISLTATAVPLLDLTRDLETGKSSTSRRSTVSKRFNGMLYYEHGQHSSKSNANRQVRALRKAGYKARVS